MRFNRSTFFILPVVIVLIFVVVFPLIYSIYVSLFNYDLRLQKIQFIGIANYIAAFHDSRFISDLVRTGELVAMCVIVEFLLGLLLALVLYYHAHGTLRNIAVVILSIPPMIAPVVVGYMGRLIFHPLASPVNYILQLMGVPWRPLWHASAQTSLLTVFLADAWQWTPFMMLLLLSGLMALPRELIESARVDGATSWQEIRYVVLPMLKTVATVAILFRSLDVLRMFDVVYVLTYGGPGTSSEVVSFYAYLVSFDWWRIGYGAAISWILTIILSVLATIYLKYIMKGA